MSTIMQEQVADNIIKNLRAKYKKNKRELLVSAGYSEVTAKATPSVILESKGVQTALRKRGFNVDNAKRVVSEIMDNADNWPRDRISAAKEVFAVEGAYAPTKSLNVNINVTELQETIKQQIAKFRAMD